MTRLYQPGQRVMLSEFAEEELFSPRQLATVVGYLPETSTYTVRLDEPEDEDDDGYRDVLEDQIEGPIA